MIHNKLSFRAGGLFFQLLPSRRHKTLVRPKRSRLGFTLVEVMIATFVAAIGLTAGFASLIQFAKMTKGAICENTATTVMQGFVEQIKSVNFAELDGTSISTRLNGL